MHLFSELGTKDINTCTQIHANFLSDLPVSDLLVDCSCAIRQFPVLTLTFDVE